MNQIITEQFEPVSFEQVPQIDVIVFAPGRWGSPQQFDLVRKELEKEDYGYQTDVIDFPNQDPDATQDDFVEAAGTVLLQYEGSSVYGIGYSRGADPMVRAALRWPNIVKRLGYLCARLPRAEGQDLPENQPSRVAGDYLKWAEKVGPEITAKDFSEARKFLFSLCTYKQAREGFNTLRPHHAQDAETAEAIPEQPAVATDVYQTTDDAIRKIEGAEADSKAYQGVEVTKIIGDHTPHIQQPDFLAETFHRQIGQAPLLAPKDLGAPKRPVETLLNC